jgi:hypothetical protein
MAKNKKIEVIGREISLYSEKSDDYISLTDMARYRDSERTNYIIQNWMRTRSAIEFCGLWEQMNNPDFKRIEFDAFKNESGANSFTLTPQKWIENTNAIGIISKSGRYGGTFAHRDIAFEFATWISAEFKFYLIKEFQRLKEDEINRQKLDWNLQPRLHWKHSRSVRPWLSRSTYIQLKWEDIRHEMAVIQELNVIRNSKRFQVKQILRGSDQGMKRKEKVCRIAQIGINL